VVTKNAININTSASGTILQGAGVGVTPAFSTATYPSTAGSSGKILISDGTNIVSSTPTYPNTAASTGKILRADGTNWSATTATFPDTAGTSGNVLTSDGTNWSSSAPAGGASTLYINYQWTNLGINYNAGTFTVKGATADLSGSNIAYITFQSDTTPGQSVTIGVTANQDFIDDAGASEIVGNLFGFTSGVAITVDVPFFIYAVINDAENAVSFMLSREPGRKLSPASANIGTPASAVADVQSAFFAFNSVTVADYDTNPCVLVGSIRMRMSASNDWTVQALNNKFDGIGNFQAGNTFSMPLGQMGATTSAITVNAGTPPVFTTTNTTYRISPEGIVLYSVYLFGDGGTDGSGATNAQIVAPYLLPTTAPPLGSAIIATPAIAASVGIALCSSQSIVFYVGAVLQTWGLFTNGTRQIQFTISYNTLF
jgi:hypothetical protein